jgi:N-acyl-D-amino-acid deacylase
MMSVLIKNAKVVDGTGSPWFWSDVLIQGQEIKQIGRKLDVKADRTIDAEGLVLTPGFVDVHCHNDGTVVFHPDMECDVTQGVTTDILGHCGYSPYPSKATYIDSLTSNIARSVLWYRTLFAKSSYDWNSLTEYVELIRSRRPAINMVPLIGLSPLVWEAGYRPQRETDARRLTAKEMAKVKELVRDGFRQGAFGFTTSRDYNPNQYVDPLDILEVVKVVAEYKHPWFPHTKDVATPYGIKEAIEMAKQTGVKLHIDHVNVLPNFYPGGANTLHECLGIISAGRDQGVDVTFDVMTWMNYCYPPGSLIHLLRHFCTVYPDKRLEGSESVEEFRKAVKHPDYREKVKYTVENFVHRAAIRYGYFFREHLDSVMLLNTGDEKLEGKTLGQIAKERGENPKDLYYDISFGTSPILASSPKTVVIWTLTTGHPFEENVAQAFSHPFAVPSIDCPTHGVPVETHYNSSSYGAFPRGYRLLVDRGMEMEEVIKKMTSYPARILGITDRGMIREGMKADLLIIDPTEFGPGNNLINPTERAHGINYVMVNGKLVMDNKKLTEERPGEVLLRGHKGVSKDKNKDT